MKRLIHILHNSHAPIIKNIYIFATNIWKRIPDGSIKTEDLHGGGGEGGSVFTALLCDICQRRPELADSPLSRDRPGRGWIQSGGHYDACSGTVSAGLQRSLCDCQQSPRYCYHHGPRCDSQTLRWCGRSLVLCGLKVHPWPQFNWAAAGKMYVHY